MPLVQVLLTAASLAAVGGGAWGVDRALDGFCELTPETTQESGEREAEDEDRRDRAETRLHY